MKYNYVIFGTDGDFFQQQISEIIGLENVRWIPFLMCNMNTIPRFVYRAHTSWLINEHIRLPLKKVWNGFYFKDDFEIERPICFVFYASPENYDLGDFGYLDYLKSEYPDCKLVIYFMDLIKHAFTRCQNFSIEKIKSRYDLVITYNQNDAEEYGFQYFVGHLSKLNITPSADAPRSDVVFVGLAKDRLPILLEIYEKLTAEGLRCDFHITGVPTKEQQYADKITYNKPMPYAEMVQRSVDSKCILEVVQKGAMGLSSRFSEAFMYDKLLISNNPIICYSEFYHPEWMTTFKTPDEICVDWIRANWRDVRNNYQGELSPKKLLNAIEKHDFSDSF